MTALLTPAEAALEIAVKLVLADSFTVAAGAGMTRQVGSALASIPDWVGYLDNGEGAVMQTDASEAVPVVEHLNAVALVVLIPKSIAPAVLANAFEAQIPDDGSQDFLLITDPGLPLAVPQLFLDAADLAAP